MTAEKHPLETVREALEKGIELLEPFEESGLLGNQALNKHRASLDILTTYMSQPQSCAECERLGRENARLREAVGDLVDRAYILKAHPAVVAAMSSAEDE